MRIDEAVMGFGSGEPATRIPYSVSIPHTLAMATD
jgi:hypothetical protein